MNLIQEIMKGVFTHYKTTTLWTTDAVPFYLNDVPQSVKYPIIVMNHIAGNFSMAMPTAVKTAGWDYCDAIFQFSIFGNDRQHPTTEEIAERLSLAFHRIPIVLGGDCSHIATILVNNRTAFYDSGQKIWHKTQDYRILAGA